MDNIHFKRPSYAEDFWLLGSLALIVGPILYGLIAFVL